MKHCLMCEDVVYRFSACKKHHRFKQMRTNAKALNKRVPSFEEFQKIIPKDMKCIGCGKVMNWLMKEGITTTLTLQHNRDGTLGILCYSCNTRHSDYPGDTFYTRDKNKKMCPGCKKELDFSFFHKDKSRPSGLDAYCKRCSIDYQKARYRKNRKEILLKDKIRRQLKIKNLKPE